MKVKLTKRLGQNKAGTILDVTSTEVDWLVTNGLGTEVDAPEGQPAPEDTTPTEGQPSTEDLRAEAKRLGLPTQGGRAQLADRIEQHRVKHPNA